MDWKPTGRADLCRQAEIWAPWQSMVAAGIASERAGNVDAAVSNYRQALTLRPGDPQASLCFAQLLLRVRRPGEAAAVLRKAKAPQGEPAVKHMLGLALLEAGDVDEAVLELRKALAIAPDFAPDPEQSRQRRAARRRRETRRGAFPARSVDRTERRDGEVPPGRLALYVGRREEARTLYREMLQAGERQAVIYAGLIEASDITEEPPEYSEVRTHGGGHFGLAAGAPDAAFCSCARRPWPRA